MQNVMTVALLNEYENMIGALGKNPTFDDIVNALVNDGDWTKRGAQEVVDLASTHGIFILRNALALACAMGIEDGVARL